MHTLLYCLAIMTSLQHFRKKENGVGTALNVATLPLILCRQVKTLRMEVLEHRALSYTLFSYFLQCRSYYIFSFLMILLLVHAFLSL